MPSSVTCRLLGVLAAFALALPAATAEAGRGGAGRRVPTRRLLPREIAHTDQGPRGAPTIVFVHGAGSDRRTFIPLASSLARRHRVITFDQRGHGETPAVGLDYSSETLALDLEVLRDHLQLGRIHLAGHSFGARTAVRYASLFPHQVASVLVEDMDMASRFTLTDPLRAQLEADAIARGDVRELYGHQAASEELGPALLRVASRMTFLQADPAFGAAMSPTGIARIRLLRPDAAILSVPGSGHFIHQARPDILTLVLDDHVAGAR
ncbi:MAG TPA: alpha/beta fold hydrolase [Kofleriaceae bacterium]|nr:alpha/beta fold hydrolase [Kofleriaceae bacterium]